GSEAFWLKRNPVQVTHTFLALPEWLERELPMELFPALFKDAFNGRHIRIVKAMVAAWPFPCLPVGTLMKSPNLETLQAVLDGVDVQLERKFHPRREKLQVLDLSNVHHEFWKMWTGTDHGDCPAETVAEKQVVKVLPRYALRQRLKVIVHLCLRVPMDEGQAHILEWARQRQGSILLCCRKMQIWPLPSPAIKDILNVFSPQHTEELELNMGWDLSTLASFALCLGQMKCLRKLSLARIDKNAFKFGEDGTADRQESCVSKFVAQFSKLNLLEHLFMKGIYFLGDHMMHVLRGDVRLRTPLETLSITRCHLSQSDLNHFPWCTSLRQLRHLDLSGLFLWTLDPEPLRLLLEKVADSLQSLSLQGCKMKDPQLTVLMPALSQLSQLSQLNLYDNDFSMHILKDLLDHTANLSKMTVEHYPAPLESYDHLGYISIERFAQLCPELMGTLRARRQPKSIFIATHFCRRCSERCVYDLGPRLCLCWQ
ncbi:PRAME family member 8-like, partial [Sigmodon hispidus]